MWSILCVGPFAFTTGGYQQEVCCDNTDSRSNHCSKFQCDSLSIHCSPCSMNNPAVFCIGYAFLLFQDESSVQALIDACIEEDGKLYLCVSSPTIKDKPVSGKHTQTHPSAPAVSSELSETICYDFYLTLWVKFVWNCAQFSLFLELKPVALVCDRSRSARGTWTTVILWWMDLSLWTRGKPSLWEASLVRSVQVSLIFVSIFLWKTWWEFATTELIFRE